MNKKILIALASIVIILWGAVLYMQTLHYPFQFDDHIYIVNNKSIHDLFDLKAIWHAFGHPSRFVALLTFALNYHFHGLEVFGYHLFNFSVHILSTFAAWWFFRLILASPHIQPPVLRQHRQLVAFWAAVIFLVHPLQTQAVTYISQRITCLAVLFYILSLCLYIKARLTHQKEIRWLFFVCSWVVALAGMFTKQIVFTWPFAVMLVEFYFLRPKPNRSPWKYIIPFLLLLFIIPAMFAFDVNKVMLRSMLSGSHEGDMITSGNYFLTQFRVIVTYLRLLFIPLGQNLYYDFPLSTRFFEPKIFLSFLILTYLLLMALRLRRTHPVVSFGIFWFFLSLSVESSIIPIHHVIFEHRLYLPMVGFCLVLTGGMFALCKDAKRFTIAVVLLALIYSYLTFERNGVWRSEVALWQDVSKKSPRKIEAYFNLGTAYLHENNLDLALANFNRALALDANLEKVYENRGIVYAKMGRDDLALADFNRALEINPHYVSAYHNRGMLYTRQDHIDLALVDFNRVVELNPYDGQNFFNRANLYVMTKQYDSALSDYTHALKLNPDDVDSYNNRGGVYFHKKMWKEALGDFNKAIALNPQYGQGYYNRSLVFEAMGQSPDALKDALHAKSLGYEPSDKNFFDKKR